MEPVNKWPITVVFDSAKVFIWVLSSDYKNFMFKLEHPAAIDPYDINSI